RPWGNLRTRAFSIPLRPGGLHGRREFVLEFGRSDLTHLTTLLTSKRHWRLLCQQFFKKSERAGIVRLSQPEHRVFTHFFVPVLARHCDQLGHSLVFGKLAQGEDRLLLYVGFRIVFNGIGYGRCSVLSGLLRQPEQGLSAHVRV